MAKRKTCLLHLCGTAVLFVNDKFSVMFTLCYLMLFFLTCWHQGSLDNPNLDNASKYLPEQVLRNISIWRGKWQGLLLRDLWQWKIFTALMILIPQPVAADGFYTAVAATRAQGASPLPVRSATSVCCWSDYKVKRLLHYAVVTFNVSLLCVQH